MAASSVVVVSSRLTTAHVSHGCWTLCEYSIYLSPICVPCVVMVDSSLALSFVSPPLPWHELYFLVAVTFCYTHFVVIAFVFSRV